KTRGAVGGFQEHLLSPRNRKDPSFAIPAEARKRIKRAEQWRQNLAMQEYQRAVDEFNKAKLAGQENIDPPVQPPPSEAAMPTGIIVGNAIASYRKKTAHADQAAKDVYMLRPGDEVRIITYKGSQELLPASAGFVVCDFFKSEMSEYDSNYAFV